MEETKTIHLMAAPGGIYNDQNFHIYYESVAKYYEWEEKIFIGEKNKCRYCPETNPSKFNHIAHTCPEFTGNKSLFSNDECDTCNDIFSKYETELSNHSHFMRTLIGIRGKNRIPSFISNNQSVSFKYDGKKLVAHVNLDKKKRERSLQDEGLTIKLDFQKNEQAFDFKFKKKKHIPLFLFKALNKIGFSIMPQSELDAGGFGKFTEWLKNTEQTFSNEHEKPYFYIYHNQFSPLKRKPFLMLFKKREEYAKSNFPTFSFFFMFANFAYQVFIPFYEADEHFLFENTLCLPIIPEIVTKTEGKDKLIWMNGFSPNATELEDFHFIVKGSIN